jgi:SAM-dependent methyltransferase
MRVTSIVAVLGLVSVLVVAGLDAQQPVDPRGSQADQRARWNKEFSSGIPNLRNVNSSEFLAAVIKGRKPGAALDLGIGQGRNAIFLAAQGWQVTGVDISDVAVAQARKNADQKAVKIATIISDLDEYDFGVNQWDLVTSFYMHSWHRNSKTDVPARILRSLKPGGLLVMEAFRRPPNTNGLVVAELTSLFRDFRIVMNEESVTKADWGSVETTELVRFVAEKPMR